jgi:hypothetical protein
VPTAGSTVKAGFYFNRDKLDLIAVGNAEGALPGDEGERYARVPAVLALLLAPILGALFVVIAPGARLGLLLHRLGRLALPMVRFAWQRLAFAIPSRRRREPEFIDEAKEAQAPSEPSEK